MITVAKGYESRVELGITQSSLSPHESIGGLLSESSIREAASAVKEPSAKEHESTDEGAGMVLMPLADTGSADDEIIQHLERLIDHITKSRAGDYEGGCGPGEKDTARNNFIIDFLERKTNINIRKDLVVGNAAPSHRNLSNNIFRLEPGIASNFRRTTTALAVLGRVCESGLFGVRKSRTAAYYLYKHASLQNCPAGTYHLARCLEFRIGTERDLEKACYFYRLSYKLGSIRGLHRFSIMLLRGNYFVERDVSLGCHLLTVAANKTGRSYPQPYYDLGMVYRAENNKDIVADPKYAFRIFLKGAGLGCPNCQYRVSEEYERGTNTEKDMEKAFMWYKTAAEQGQADAQYKVAHILTCIMNSREGYCAGYGMEKYGTGRCDGVEALKTDIEESVSYSQADSFRIYRQCEDSGFLGIDIRKYYGTGTDIRREALRMAERSAASGDTRSMLLAANMLESGDKLGKDILLCLWYYKMAVSMGCKEATYKVVSIETKIGSRDAEARPQRRGLLFKIMEHIKIL